MDSAKVVLNRKIIKALLFGSELSPFLILYVPKCFVCVFAAFFLLAASFDNDDGDEWHPHFSWQNSKGYHGVSMPGKEGMLGITQYPFYFYLTVGRGPGKEGMLSITVIEKKSKGPRREAKEEGWQ